MLFRYFQESSDSRTLQVFDRANFDVSEQFTRPFKQMFRVGKLRAVEESERDMSCCRRNPREMFGHLLRTRTVAYSALARPGNFDHLWQDGVYERSRLASKDLNAGIKPVKHHLELLVWLLCHVDVSPRTLSLYFGSIA
jgi:hypothetical protein